MSEFDELSSPRGSFLLRDIGTVFYIHLPHQISLAETKICVRILWPRRRFASSKVVNCAVASQHCFSTWIRHDVASSDECFRHHGNIFLRHQFTLITTDGWFGTSCFIMSCRHQTMVNMMPRYDVDFDAWITTQRFLTPLHNTTP
jgi:hypothetical protein